jgi:hypothetical protein
VRARARERERERERERAPVQLRRGRRVIECKEEMQKEGGGEAVRED